jgi:hypothetical protein
MGREIYKEREMKELTDQEIRLVDIGTQLSIDTVIEACKAAGIPEQQFMLGAMAKCALFVRDFVAPKMLTEESSKALLLVSVELMHICLSMAKPMFLTEADRG